MCYCAASLLLSRAAMGHHVDLWNGVATKGKGSRSADLSEQCFKYAAQCTSELISSLEFATNQSCGTANIGHILNEAQWSRLNRQGLPLQLQLPWLKTHLYSIQHRHHLCASMRYLKLISKTQPDETNNKIANEILRASESSALKVFCGARSLLLDGIYLRARQLCYAQYMYDNTLRELIKFRTQGYMCDAEKALEEVNIGAARQLADIGPWIGRLLSRMQASWQLNNRKRILKT